MVKVPERDGLTGSAKGNEHMNMWIPFEVSAESMEGRNHAASVVLRLVLV